MTWQNSRLGNHFKIKHGYAFKSKYFDTSGKYIVVTPGNFYEKGGFKYRDNEKYYSADPPDNFILKKGDLIIAMTEQAEGLLGSSAIVNQDNIYLHNQRLGLVINLNQKTLNKYFLYCLFNTALIRNKIRATATGLKVRHTAPDRILNIEVSLPDITTQQRIAEILSNYDRLIDNNNRRIALLEESIHLLYKEWFVRLRFPGYESVKIVDGIPEGWNRKTLKDIALSIRQSIHPSNTDPNTPYVGLEHIPRQSIALTSWGYSNQVDSNKFVFTKSDILFGKIRPYFHKVVFAPVNGICSSDAIVIRPINQDLFGLTLSLVSSVAFVNYTSKTSKEGSKMPRANWDVMEQYPILIPSSKLLREFNTLVNLVTNQITNLIFTNQRLRQARDLLLPHLINGSIAV
ncbi:restriction endonuclease subunit S [Nostoc sp.]|uniref:restriction endonuclease subunit S n=1 Tax=Nostoc sp. TaxID=1180 RepID=UPI002FF6CCAA